MNQILNENVLTIQQACDRLPRRRLGRRTHSSTVVRWILRGLGGVKLEAVKIGTWLTSEEALSRFLVAVAKQEGESATTAAPSAIIDSKLAAAGLIRHDVVTAGGSAASRGSPQGPQAGREEAIDRAERELRDQGL